MAKDLAEDKWTLGNLKELYTEGLWNWVKSDRIDANRDAYLTVDKCVDF